MNAFRKEGKKMQEKQHIVDVINFMHFSPAKKISFAPTTGRHPFQYEAHKVVLLVSRVIRAPLLNEPKVFYGIQTTLEFIVVVYEIILFCKPYGL